MKLSGLKGVCLTCKDVIYNKIGNFHMNDPNPKSSFPLYAQVYK